MRHWIENDAEWYEQRLVHCGCCGRLIARHFLIDVIAGREQIFCGDDCADLYAAYLLPARGPDDRPSADVRERYEALMTQ